MPGFCATTFPWAGTMALVCWALWACAHPLASCTRLDVTWCRSLSKFGSCLRVLRFLVQINAKFPFFSKAFILDMFDCGEGAGSLFSFSRAWSELSVVLPCAGVFCFLACSFCKFSCCPSRQLHQQLQFFRCELETENFRVRAGTCVKDSITACSASFYFFLVQCLIQRNSSILEWNQVCCSLLEIRFRIHVVFIPCEVCHFQKIVNFIICLGIDLFGWVVVALLEKSLSWNSANSLFIPDYCYSAPLQVVGVFQCCNACAISVGLQLYTSSSASFSLVG
jgi:hypothetical protein